MGGDGGTLNNSRREHVQARLALFGPSTTPPPSQRVSISECALSKQPLTPPHVVVDRLGQLYNKDALISYLLSRRTRDSDKDDVFGHIRSVKRDTRLVRFVEGVLMCDVTRKEVTEEGGFSVGWECGCVCKDVKGVDGVDGEGCLACGKQGERIPLGMKMAQVGQRLKALRERKGRGKKRRGARLEQSETERVPVRKIPKVTADVS